MFIHLTMKLFIISIEYFKILIMLFIKLFSFNKFIRKVGGGHTPQRRCRESPQSLKAITY